MTTLPCFKQAFMVFFPAFLLNNLSNNFLFCSFLLLLFPSALLNDGPVVVPVTTTPSLADLDIPNANTTTNPHLIILWMSLGPWLGRDWLAGLPS